MLTKIWRFLWPKWEYRWCVVTSAINSDWIWTTKQCWFRNGEPHIKHSFLHVLLPENDTHQEAEEMRIRLNAVRQRYLEKKKRELT